MFLHIIEAKHVEGYTVEVAFNDGSKGIADLSPALKGSVFEPLKEIAVFAQLRVDPELETIVWPNGADLAPEYIYYQAFKEKPELEARFKEWGYIS